MEAYYISDSILHLLADVVLTQIRVFNYPFNNLHYSICAIMLTYKYKTNIDMNGIQTVITNM